MFGRGMGMGGCKRCSFCSIHYPPTSEHDTCWCGEQTCYFSNVEPDEDWREKVEYAKSKPVERQIGVDPDIHRFDGFLRLGYGLDDAQRLFNATWGKWGLPLWPGTVEAALAGGCDPKLALEIFA